MLPMSSQQRLLHMDKVLPNTSASSASIAQGHGQALSLGLVGAGSGRSGPAAVGLAH